MTGFGTLHPRPLQAGDLFPAAEILAALGASELAELLSALEEGENPDAALSAGILQILLRNLPACREPLMRFLAGLCGVSARTLEQAPPGELVRALRLLFAQEETADFFAALFSPPSLAGSGSSCGCGSAGEISCP